MKNKYILVNAFFLSLVACGSSNNQTDNKEDDNAKASVSSTNNSISEKKGIISFKVNGDLVKTSAWNVSVSSSMTGTAILNVTSNMKEDARNINININGFRVEGFKAGEYPFVHGLRRIDTTHGIAYGGYRPDYKKILNSYRFMSGAFVIKSTGDDKLLNATFSGKAKNDKGEEVEITEGQVINAPIKPAHPGAIN